MHCTVYCVYVCEYSMLLETYVCRDQLAVQNTFMVFDLCEVAVDIDQMFLETKTGPCLL